MVRVTDFRRIYRALEMVSYGAFALLVGSANGVADEKERALARGELEIYNGTSIQPRARGDFEVAPDLDLFGELFMHFPGEETPEGAEEEEKTFTEIDETLGIAYRVESLRFEAGHTWYHFPVGREDLPATAEFFGRVAHEGMLHSTVTVFHDYRAFDNELVQLELRYPFELTSIAPGVNMEAFFRTFVGAHGKRLYHDDGVEASSIGLQGAVDVGRVAVVPQVVYTRGWDEETDRELWFGFSLRSSFE
jgi:hypothetical protein